MRVERWVKIETDDGARYSFRIDAFPYRPQADAVPSPTMAEMLFRMNPADGTVRDEINPPTCSCCSLVQGVGWLDAVGGVAEPDPAPGDDGHHFMRRWFCSDECLFCWLTERAAPFVEPAAPEPQDCDQVDCNGQVWTQLSFMGQVAHMTIRATTANKEKPEPETSPGPSGVGSAASSSQEASYTGRVNLATGGTLPTWCGGNWCSDPPERPSGCRDCPNHHLAPWGVQ